MGDGFEAGGGTGVAGLGPLQQMWRDVYRKAGEAAEERATELLKYHVYVYPHGAGGGGAGNLVLVETQTMADATATRVDFATIPAAGAALLLVVSAHQVVAGGSAGSGVLLLRLNDDATTNYWNKYHEVYGTTNSPTPVAHQVLGDDASSLPLGRLSFADDTSPDTATAGIVALFPGHGVAGRRKQVLSLGSAFTGKGAAGAHYLGDYGGEWRGTAAITKLSLLPSGSGATFAAGGVFTLYQLTQTPSGGGGGGGGLATDPLADAKGDLFAASGDNAIARLPVGTNGQVLTADSTQTLGVRWATPSGGAGTGNTTMYTQTTSPTGATNSLWFNPSEAA
jgi:hypothetical protein